MKKILFVMTPALPMPPVKGGAVQTLVQSLIDYNEVEQKYELSVISIPGGKTASEKYQFTKYIYAKVPLALIMLKEREIKFLTGFAYRAVQVIYTHYVKKIVALKEYDMIIFENELHIEGINTFKGKPLKVLHLHNDYINVEVQNAKKTVEKFDYVIAVSDYINHRVTECSSVSKVYTVHNGIRIDRFKRNMNTRKKIRTQLGIRDDEIVFCFSGRLVKEKGIMELIKAFNMLPDRLGKNAVLLIIGSKLYGVNTEDVFLRSLKEESSKSEYRIIYTGFVDYEKIHQYYAAADVGCLLSLCEEAFPISIIEYKASGMPVITSDTGGTREQMSDEYGYIIERSPQFVERIGSVMEIYLKNKEKIKEQGDKAEINARKYDVVSYCREFYKTLEKIYNGGE